MSQHTFILYGNYNNPYLRIVRISDGFVYDIAADAFAASPTWENTAIALDTKNAVINGWPVDVPQTLPNGTYDMQLYDAQTPAASNTMITGWRLTMPYRLITNPTEFPVDVFGRVRVTSI